MSRRVVERNIAQPTSLNQPPESVKGATPSLILHDDPYSGESASRPSSDVSISSRLRFVHTAEWERRPGALGTWTEPALAADTVRCASSICCKSRRTFFRSSDMVMQNR